MLITLVLMPERTRRVRRNFAKPRGYYIVWIISGFVEFSDIEAAWYNQHLTMNDCGERLTSMSWIRYPRPWFVYAASQVGLLLSALATTQPATMPIAVGIAMPKVVIRKTLTRLTFAG